MIEDNQNFKTIRAAFPHIAKKLELFWGHPEFNALMDDLHHDKRPVQRNGFPLDILMALDSLDSEHTRAFPKLARKNDMWGPGH